MDNQIDNQTKNETEKPAPEPGLTPEQELALNSLQPDFEPPKSGDDKESKASKQHETQVQMLGMLVAGVFAVLSARLGDHWALKPSEVKAIAEPGVLVLNKYVPDFESGPEVALLAGVSMVVLPRAMMQSKLKEQAHDGDQSATESPE